MGTIQESPAPQNEEAPTPPSNNAEANADPVTPVDKNPPNTVVESSNKENSSGEVVSGVSGGGDGQSNVPNSLPTNEGGGGDGEKSDAKDTKTEQPKSAPEGGPKIVKASAPAKSSGIPTATRITRPCVGQQKPAVPTTPTKNNSVLTEDTDSFIIGDRVWVGGLKPGQIAYIGETQFAPGEWAGIALDHPIGKNDGSVGGIRYFQCESKRGVFSRLTRLTRFPLPGADEGSICTSTYSVSSTTPVNNGVRRRVGSPLSPTGSTRSLRKSPPSPSLSTSNTSLSSVTHVIDFKVGDRVIIKSSQGSKVGTLRYMGITDFASGEWCGVELDEPRGKNDGSVEGKRYFDCRPQFGLFAPATKVSKSPLRYKPGNCIIHSGAGLPPSGIRRAGSKESMTSMTSSLASATSGARRDVLREKQLHIEQLLKERDLDRAEVTRAANQADDVEQKLITLRSEYEHYRSECEAKLHEYSGLLSELKIDHNSVLSQLDDEKRKNEDLQFKFEEAAITKGDIEQSIANQGVTNESNLRRIKELEEQLAQERQKVETLEGDSNKLFEAEEALVKTREELDAVKNDLHHTIGKRSVLEEESLSTAASITSLKEQLENTHQQLEQTRIESAKTIEQLKSEISASALESRSVRGSFDKELEEYRNKLKENNADCRKQEEEIAALKAELAQTKQLLEEKSLALEKKISESSELENNLKTELERSKRELSVKDVDIENNTDTIKTKEREIRSLKTQLETAEVDLKARSLDIERYQGGMKDAEVNYKKEIEELRTALKTKIAEKEEHEKTCAITISQKEAKLEDCNKTISQNVNEIEKLQVDLKEAKEAIERTSSEVHDRHTRQIEIREAQLMAMAAEIQQKNEEITKCSIVTTKLEDDICTKNGIIEKLRLELDSFKRRFESEQLSISRYNEQINGLQLNVGDLQRKLVVTEQRLVEVSEHKKRLEVELHTLMSSTGDYSAKLQELNTVVIQKEQLLEAVRIEFTEKIQHAQRVEQQLQLQLQKVTEDAQRTRLNCEEKLRTAIESESLLRQRCETAGAETAKIRDELMLKVNELQHLLEQKDFALKKTSDKCMESERYLKEQLGRTTGELQKTVESCQQKIGELTAENINVKNALTQKAEMIIEANAKLQHFMGQAQQNEIEIRRACQEQIKKIEFQLAEKNAQVQQLIAEINLLKRDCDSQHINISEKDHRIAQLTTELHTTQQLVTQLQTVKDQLQLQQVESSKQSSASNAQCNDLLNQIAVLNEKAELADRLAKDLQIQKNVYAQLFQQLQITERQKQHLIANLEAAVKTNGESDKCYYMLELAKNLQAATTDEQAKKIIELQQTVQIGQQQLAETQNQLGRQRVEILRLQEELLKAQQTCQSQATGLQNSSQINNNPVCNDHQQLLEEKQLAEGQIQFLNSIIVDMQRKNQEQQARIEILESGYSPAAADELNLYGLPVRSIPPRVYCDICEEFDKHETEDCPLQATEADPTPCGHPRAKKDAPSERPYCEICEIFGHCTEDCKDDQTF